MHAIQNRSHLYKNALSTKQDSGTLPVGIYHACLDAVQRLRNSFGSRYSFVFRITEGRYAGETVTLSTSTNLSQHSKLGLTIKAMLGRELASHELTKEFNPICLSGTGCRILTVQESNRAGKIYATVDRILK
jgi:hypothetical protein